MIIDEQYEGAFAENRDSLRLLEIAFNLAGLDVSFHCCVEPVYGKVVEVFKNKRIDKRISIEADSLGQAIKDVAAGVRL